jgi:hypothetical protein
MGIGGNFLGDKVAGREAYRSTPYSIEVKVYRAIPLLAHTSAFRICVNV